MQIEPKAPMPRFLALVLEDDRESAELLTSVIQSEGGEVAVCGTLTEAYEAIANEYFDLFILDHLLPDGNGSAFFYHLREQGIQAPAIMLTGLPDLPKAVELTRNGLFDYLAKPFISENFVACLKRALLRVKQSQIDLGFPDFVGRSPAMLEVYRLVQRAAEHPNATVLLTGETGVGKDLTAQMIHQLTNRDTKQGAPFISLNCSTLPAEIFEAELFGAEKGAYTGAHQPRSGLVDAAQGGTLFLDEIAEVSLLLQAKLLQFLETRAYRRLGSIASREFEGRIIAATNKPLAEEVEQGRFRSDLLYRLDVYAIHVPPLRERMQDIPPLVEMLLEKLAVKYRRQKPLVRPEDLSRLEGYSFPGNIRELRNVLERSLLQTPPDSSWLELDRVWLRKARLELADTGETAVTAAGIQERALNPLETQEYALIKKALIEENGVIRRAAAKLGLTHQSLLRRLQKWPELRLPR